MILNHGEFKTLTLYTNLIQERRKKKVYICKIIPKSEQSLKLKTYLMNHVNTSYLAYRILDIHFQINNKCLFLANDATIKVIDINLSFIEKET